MVVHANLQHWVAIHNVIGNTVYGIYIVDKPQLQKLEHAVGTGFQFQQILNFRFLYIYSTGYRFITSMVSTISHVSYI